MVVYLPSTFGERPRQDLLTGNEWVLCPVINTRVSTPWKLPLPEWLAELLQHVQRCWAGVTKWALMGFSRGAAWGLQVATHSGLRWQAVLLLAPYLPPSCSSDHGQLQQIRMGLATLGTSASILYGELDPWKPCERLLEMMSTCHCRCLPQLGHAAILPYAWTNCWPLLAATGTPPTHVRPLLAAAAKSPILDSMLKSENCSEKERWVKHMRHVRPDCFVAIARAPRRSHLLPEGALQSFC